MGHVAWNKPDLILIWFDWLIDWLTNITRTPLRWFREEVQAGIRRRYEIVTHGIDVWHVLEYDHYKLVEPSHGQFHAGDTYVIRWNYSTLHVGEFSRSTAWNMYNFIRLKGSVHNNTNVQTINSSCWSLYT